MRKAEGENRSEIRHSGVGRNPVCRTVSAVCPSNRRKRKRNPSILLAALLLLVMSGAAPAQETTTIVGKTTQEELFRESPTFLEGYRKYTPDKNAVERIARTQGPFDVLVFFGTWCQDSVSEVPKILKVLDAAGNQELRLVLYAVDREKKDGGGMAEKFSIERVPTTIILQNGKELGRIVEYPQSTNEGDLLKMIK